MEKCARVVYWGITGWRSNKSFNTFPAGISCSREPVPSTTTKCTGGIFILAHRKILYYNLCYPMEKFFLKRLQETVYYSFRNCRMWGIQLFMILKTTWKFCMSYLKQTLLCHLRSFPPKLWRIFFKFKQYKKKRY